MPTLPPTVMILVSGRVMRGGRGRHTCTPIPEFPIFALGKWHIPRNMNNVPIFVYSNSLIEVFFYIVENNDLVTMVGFAIQVTSSGYINSKRKISLVTVNGNIA